MNQNKSQSKYPDMYQHTHYKRSCKSPYKSLNKCLDNHYKNYHMSFYMNYHMRSCKFPYIQKSNHYHMFLSNRQSILCKRHYMYLSMCLYIPTSSYYYNCHKPFCLILNKNPSKNPNKSPGIHYHIEKSMSLSNFLRTDFYKLSYKKNHMFPNKSYNNHQNKLYNNHPYTFPNNYNRFLYLVAYLLLREKTSEKKQLSG